MLLLKMKKAIITSSSKNKTQHALKVQTMCEKRIFQISSILFKIKTGKAMVLITFLV